MLPEFQLILNNIATTGAVIIFTGLSLFVFLNNKKKESNIALALALLWVAIFFTSHLFGTNVKDPNLSQKILLWNVSTIFMATFNLHAIIALLNKARQMRLFIILMHLSVLIISILFFIFPEIFLLPSKPKMYFPNYYEPGPLNWVRLVLPFLVILPYAFYLMTKAYQQTSSIIEKKQIKYLSFAMLAGWAIGFIPNFLVYDIKIDPILGVPAAFLFSIPFIYGAIQYELFNIKVIAKQAFVYSVAVGLVGIIIAFLNFSSQWIAVLYPQFPLWLIYFSSSIVVVTVSIIIWKKMKENDLLKYEFLTAVTHKFRTPLTVIKWATENLSASDLSEEEKTQISYIKKENAKLVELTNMLIRISRNERDGYEYLIKKNNLSEAVDEVIDSLSAEASEKNIIIEKNYKPEIFAYFDQTKINFVIQVILENAIHYNSKNSVVSVSLKEKGNSAICQIKDQGMGIAPADLPRLFIKFYRAQNAKLADTEGMGIGLSISKEIIENHGGKIWAESEGVNKGSVFAFTLPTEK